MKPILLLFASLLPFLMSNRSLADDYDPFPDNNKTLELTINGGYSIITGEKSVFWDNGYNLGVGFNFYFTQDYLVGVTAGYTAYYPRPEINQIDREYRYELYPLTFNFQSKLGVINDLELYGGLGLAYIYGEYKIDEFQYLTNSQKIRIRYLYATNGFGIVPNLKLRSPFGQNFAVDFSVEYNLIYMKSRNNAQLSLDHLNAKLALVYIL